MRIPLILLLIIVIICPAIDIYIWSAIRRIDGRPDTRLWARRCQTAVSVVAYLLLVVGYLLPRTEGSAGLLAAKMWLLFSFATVYMSKAVFVLIDLIGGLPRLFGASRWKPVSWVAAALAVALFGGMWYGALVNRFRTDIKSIEVGVANLPKSFDGFRVVQISDLHVGTFGSDTSFVARMVDEINALHPDMIVFTGDIVNRNSAELPPHVAPLSRLSAPKGVYAILGNHDYGDYYEWESPEAKNRNMDDLYRLFDRMGWTLLLNSTAIIRHGADSLALIGVENIGDPPFPTYGSLEEAYPQGVDGTAKILLSHNPAHWGDDISDGKVDNDIGLTLSGHTHAMQIELLGLSPAVFRYPTWGGLYSDGLGRNLYVNIGAGTVGMPMRLGATPEITLLTLHPSPPVRASTDS